MSYVSVVCLALLCLPAVAGAGTEEEVIKVTYAQWAAEIAKDADASAAIMADEYTEFNAGFPTRIDGKALNTKLANALAEGGGSMLAGEMTNAKVQAYGDVAILTYNFVGVTQDADGKTQPMLAKSTRVYVKHRAVCRRRVILRGDALEDLQGRHICRPFLFSRSHLLAVLDLHLDDLLLKIGEAPPEILVAFRQLVAFDAAVELFFAGAVPNGAALQHDALGFVEFLAAVTDGLLLVELDTEAFLDLPQLPRFLFQLDVVFERSIQELAAQSPHMVAPVDMKVRRSKGREVMLGAPFQPCCPES
jgi:ketosteroid isomerase-like protein